MTRHRDLLTIAMNYHKALPHRVRAYLNVRGIPDVSIDYHLIGWNGVRITIPIFNRDGFIVFFKLARDPDDPLPGPKMMASPGAYAEIFGWEVVLGKASPIIICEGEFDRLVLEANHFHAVTSTGGAGTFRFEWAIPLKDISEVYVCYDHDSVGHAGAERVGRMILHAKLIELPDEVGPGGDVTDYFVRLGHTRQDFLKLMEHAKPTPPAPEPVRSSVPRNDLLDSMLRQRVIHIKNAVPIAAVVGEYVKLQQRGAALQGLCPFHEDHNPSLTVYPATNTFHCYGCRMHGDVISFLRAIEPLSFSQTLDALERFASEQHGEAVQ